MVTGRMDKIEAMRYGSVSSQWVDRWWDLPTLVVDIEELGEERLRGQRNED